MSKRKPVDFVDQGMSSSSLLAIGKIVRACAELEDMLTLFICNVAEINESRAITLLGKMPFNNRVNVARYLAKMHGKESHQTFKDVFDSDIQNAVDCRNVVAHGVYLGLNRDGQYGFLTSRKFQPDDGAAIQAVICYSPESLQTISDAMGTLLPAIEKTLNIESMRSRRKNASLYPAA